MDLRRCWPVHHSLYRAAIVHYLVHRLHDLGCRSGTRCTPLGQVVATWTTINGRSTFHQIQAMRKWTSLQRNTVRTSSKGCVRISFSWDYYPRTSGNGARCCHSSDDMDRPMIINPFTAHCIDCGRMRERDLTGIRPSEVTCTNCGSKRVAIWRMGECLYSYSGHIEYPIGKQPFGTKVKGPKP